MSLPPAFQRHVDACNNAILPGARLPFHVDAHAVGWVLPDVAALVGVAASAADLPGISTRLLDAGLCVRRHELFDVRACSDGPVPAGLSPWETLVKEAGEEAGLPPGLAAQAAHRGVITYTMERPEGLRRDRLHCYDLMLPGDFVPHPVDGEVTSFELWPMGRVLETVRDTDDFKFNVNLVLIDLFQRLGYLK